PRDAVVRVFYSLCLPAAAVPTNPSNPVIVGEPLRPSRENVEVRVATRMNEGDPFGAHTRRRGRALQQHVTQTQAVLEDPNDVVESENVRNIVPAACVVCLTDRIVLELLPRPTVDVSCQSYSPAPVTRSTIDVLCLLESYVVI